MRLFWSSVPGNRRKIVTNRLRKGRDTSRPPVENRARPVILPFLRFRVYGRADAMYDSVEKPSSSRPALHC